MIYLISQKTINLPTNSEDGLCKAKSYGCTITFRTFYEEVVIGRILEA